MKTTNLITNSEATKPMDLTELMLVNALGQIEDLEDKISTLQAFIERQNHILGMLKRRARFRKDTDHNGKYDSVAIESVYCDEPEFQELMDAFELEDFKEE